MSYIQWYVDVLNCSPFDEFHLIFFYYYEVDMVINYIVAVKFVVILLIL